MARRYFCLYGSDALFKILIMVSITFIFLAASVVPVEAGNYFRYDEDVQGKIFDAETHQPLAGVVVMAMWVTLHTRITIEPEERYYDYFETLTDANGEFTIPGKGRNIFRNMPPPKISIYKAGYPIRDIRFSVTDYPDGLEVKFKDGKRIVSYQKLPSNKRKEYVEHYRKIPFYGMATPDMLVPRDKYPLYSAELVKDYQAIGMRRRHLGDPIIIKKGGIHPATSQPVSPQKSK